MKFLSRKSVVDAGKTSIVHNFISNSGNVFYSHLKNSSFEIIKNNEDETIPHDSIEGSSILNLITIREQKAKVETAPKATVKKVTKKVTKKL